MKSTTPSKQRSYENTHRRWITIWILALEEVGIELGLGDEEVELALLTLGLTELFVNAPLLGGSPLGLAPVLALRLLMPAPESEHLHEPRECITTIMVNESKLRERLPRRKQSWS